VGADEDVLDDVLGVVLGAAQERAGIADERLAVALVERGERGAITRATRRVSSASSGRERRSDGIRASTLVRVPAPRRSVPGAARASAC
jgi:hypothetical protein